MAVIVHCFAISPNIFAKTERSSNFEDASRTYSMPLFASLPNGTTGISWTETDEAGVKHLYWSNSVKNGMVLSDKKLIYASSGISSSPLMRAKVLVKKDGTLVAIFGLSSLTVQNVASSHADHSDHVAVPQKAKSSRPSELMIVFTISKDNGNSWSAPQTVHKDQTPKIIRGFFDSVVMPNDEIAVAFLKDNGNPHERDLRLVTSVNGVFGDEKVIDPFVCDCCNVNLLADSKGMLNIYYRSNINNIRDIAKMVSKDNGKTFSKPEILLTDNWEIKGCPHSGPISVSGNNTNYISWFSAAPDSPGVRLATQDGKRLTVLKVGATRQSLVTGVGKSVLLWQEPGDNDQTIILGQTINSKSEVNELDKLSIGSGTNPVGVMSRNQLWVAYEVKRDSGKNTIEIKYIEM